MDVCSDGRIISVLPRDPKHHLRKVYREMCCLIIVQVIVVTRISVGGGGGGFESLR